MSEEVECQTGPSSLSSVGSRWAQESRWLPAHGPIPPKSRSPGGKELSVKVFFVIDFVTEGVTH